MRILLFFIIAAGLGAVAPGRALAMPIYSEGEERAMVVIPDDAGTVTRYAAEELKKHLDAATDGHFQIKKESERLPNETKLPIYVGDTKAAREAGLKIDALEKNHFMVFPDQRALYLVGKDDKTAEMPVDDGAAMGSLLAVYDWLDRAVGVRWLWPGEVGTYIPKSKELSTEAGPPAKGKPSLMYTELRLYSGYYRPGKPSRYGRSGDFKDRSFEADSLWSRRHKILRTAGTASFYGHAFGDYWERFGKEHPEFFALRPDGKRGPVDKRTSLTQLCVSNPELHKVIVADWLNKRTPERPWINACENDRRVIDPFCSCPTCRSWDVPEAKVSVPINPWHIDARPKDQIDPYESVSMSDRYARFLLAVLAEGKKHDPNAKVVGYAYSFYSDPPVQTKLNEDVVIIVVPPSTYPLDKGKEDENRKLWDAWKATGAQLCYRPNDFLVGYTLPYIYPQQFGRDFKHFLNNGMIAADFDSILGMWGTQGANLYLLGRLLDRPELTSEEVMEEYYTAFGPARDIVREYVGFWEGVTANCNEKFREEINGGWAVSMRAGYRIFTPESYQKGFELLAKADEATKDDVAANRRVRYLRVWLEHAQLCTKAIELFRSFNPASSPPEDRERFNAVYHELMAFRKEHEADLVGANWPFFERWEPWRNWKG